MNLKLRAAVVADAAAIAVLATQLGYPSETSQAAARLTAAKDNPDIRALVAEQDGQVIGFIGIMVSPSFHSDSLHGYITALVVDETVRGSGAGGALLTAAETWFAERDVERVNLTTALHREAAHAFYEKRGYIFTGKRYTKSL